ncbi:MAG: ketoacyl-ACP synthase III [Treponema sp.]|jgi:3-oxoacyl-[acyl-carrier-protein] synthase-3|nr:ketoacyl-ACP synthase III [Treponema sp.]
MAIEFISTGSAIPAKRITNEELAVKIDSTDEWIFSHTGIRGRHVVNEDTATSDLAVEAAKKALLQAASWKGGSIEEEEAALRDAALGMDLIILGTATPDYIGCPSTACIVQDKLGAKNAGCMDISAGCTGFIYGLETAAALLSVNSKRKRALVIGAETLSNITDWDDRRTCVLFGDGAGAAVIEKTGAPSSGEGRRGLIRSVLHADGSGSDNLKILRGGSRNPYRAGEVIDIPPHINMNGREVYKFAVKALTDTIEELLNEEKIAVDDLARIVPHQANARIVQAAAKRLGIAEKKFFLNIEDYANTSAASIPIALDEMSRGGDLHRGDLIMTIGFGAGLTYGGNLFVW